MGEIIAAILTIAYVGLLLWSLFTEDGRDAWRWVWKNLIHSALETAKPILDDTAASLSVVMSAFADAWNQYGDTIRGYVTEPVEDAARKQVNTLSGYFTLLGESTPDQALERAVEAFRLAFGAGVSSAAVTAAFEAVFPEKLNTLNGVGAMTASFAGFDEVGKHVLAPLYENAFGKSLEYKYRSIFKPELPDEADAVTWHSRGLLTDDQLKKIFEFSGLKTEYEQAFVDSAYRAISPFIIERIAQTGKITDDQFKSFLQFAGLRPQDWAPLIEAFHEMAIDPYKKQALSALITAGERGIINGPDLDQGLTDLDVLPEAQKYVKLTIAYRRLEQLDTIYRKSVSEAYQYGQITDQEYIPAMENAGINQDDAAAHYAVDSIKKRGKEAIAAQRALTREQAAEQRAALRMYEEQFQKGDIDQVQLAASILGAGVAPELAGFLVALAVARKETALVQLYGLELHRAAAQLLREQVAVIEEQVIKKLITPQLAIDQLAALNIPGPVRENLVAKWAAQALKTIMPIGQ